MANPVEAVNGLAGVFGVPGPWEGCSYGRSGQWVDKIDTGDCG